MKLLLCCTYVSLFVFFLKFIWRFSSGIYSCFFFSNEIIIPTSSSSDYHYRHVDNDIVAKKKMKKTIEWKWKEKENLGFKQFISMMMMMIINDNYLPSGTIFFPCDFFFAPIFQFVVIVDDWFGWFDCRCFFCHNHHGMDPVGLKLSNIVLIFR